jgi:hypothetical protein
MQLRALDDAVKTVELSYAPRKPLDPLDELEDVFRSLNGLMNQPTNPAPKTPAAVAKPAATEVRPAAVAPRPAVPERPLSERPRVEPLPRREPVRPQVPPRPTPTVPAPVLRPAADTPRPTPPPLPPVRDPSRPLPGSQSHPVAPVRESLRTPSPPKDDFDDFNLDTAGDDEDVFRLPPAADIRRPVETPRRAVPAPERRRSGGFGKIAAAVIGLAALGGAGYGVWINKDDFARLVGLEQPTPAPKPSQPPADVAEAPAPEQPAAPAATDETPPKLTQRLNEDGTEADMGPAGGEPVIGEGTSVAAVTQPGEAAPAVEPPPAPEPAPVEPAPANAVAEAPTDPATPAEAPADTPAPVDVAEAPAAEEPAPPAAAAAGEQNVAVAQKAIFYEERTASSQGSAESGTTVWSISQESPGAGQPAEPAIKGVVSIPGRDIGLSMTIRRNADPTLPASHIIEMIFITPEGFSEGGIDNILRVALKSDEQQPGSPVIGLPAKIGDGFFLVALNNSKAEIDANMNLLRNQKWIDVAVVYKSGRRALITMEKGLPGSKVFDDVLKAWGVPPAG